MQEKENILKILEETKKAVAKNDTVRLKRLSNQTIHTASITQDPDNVAIAVIVYSLSKIIERGYHESPRWYNEITLNINNSIKAISENNKLGLKKSLDVFRRSLEKHSKDLDRKSTRLNSSHIPLSRMPSSA